MALHSIGNMRCWSRGYGCHVGFRELWRCAPERLDALVVRGALCTTVPRQVVVAAVVIIFPVGVVVLAIVSDQVVQAEAVVSDNEVDRMVRLAVVGLCRKAVQRW